MREDRDAIARDLGAINATIKDTEVKLLEMDRLLEKLKEARDREQGQLLISEN